MNTTAIDEAFAVWCEQVTRITGMTVDEDKAWDAFIMDFGPRNRSITPEEYAREILDNYDGPADGEAWSGGFASNH